MSNDKINRYLWFIDTLRRHGKLTRQELDEKWIRSPYSKGQRLPRRTFYNYRQAIAEIFNLEIGFDPATYEYYIEDDNGNNERMTTWMLNSTAMNNVLSGAREVSAKIFVEDVPSAREHLNTVIEALRGNHPIEFDYLPFYRTVSTTGIEMHPYFLKIFRQRWYVTGKVVGEGKIKTYSLDRIGTMRIRHDVFEPDPTFDPEEFSRYAFGVVYNQGEVKRIALRTSPREAKYLRGLPLHHTQEESIHDDFSIFHYRMRISDDLVNEILSRGNRVEVLEPPELREAVRTALRSALSQYEPKPEPETKPDETSPATPAPDSEPDSEPTSK